MMEPDFLPPNGTDPACAICREPSTAHLPWQCPEYTQRLLDALRASHEKTTLKDTNSEVPWTQLYQRIVWLESQTHVLLSWKREVDRDQGCESAKSIRHVGKTIPTTESHTQYESQDSVSMTDHAKRAPASPVSKVLIVEKTCLDPQSEPLINSERKKFIEQSELPLNGGSPLSQSPKCIRMKERLDSPKRANLHQLSEREFTPTHFIFRKSSLDSLRKDGPFQQSENSKGSKRTIPDFHDSDLKPAKKRFTIPPPPPPPPRPRVDVTPEMPADFSVTHRTAPPEASSPPQFPKGPHLQTQSVVPESILEECLLVLEHGKFV
ncbi:hypothetical protein HDU81_003845 [Chytriomyces hyalinus]|nr:hypothetical protein HDU81_003845 [Chytriomyces hyalinus]